MPLIRLGLDLTREEYDEVKLIMRSMDYEGTVESFIAEYINHFITRYFSDYAERRKRHA